MPDDFAARHGVSRERVIFNLWVASSIVRAERRGRDDWFVQANIGQGALGRVGAVKAARNALAAMSAEIHDQMIVNRACEALMAANGRGQVVRLWPTSWPSLTGPAVLGWDSTDPRVLSQSVSLVSPESEDDGPRCA